MNPTDLNWAMLLKNTQVVDLAAVRAMQAAHAALFRFDGPREIGEFVRLFRLTGLFAHFAMAEKRFPILNRAWADLERFMKHPEADEFTATSWMFLDLPVTDDGRTVAEVFAAEIAPDHPEVKRFVDVVRASRYGLYADAGGTRSSHRLVELITRRRVSVMRGVDCGPGELFWTRIIEWRGTRFMLGNTRGWPGRHREQVLDTLVGRIIESPWDGPGIPGDAAYEQFMRWAGPYWLSLFFIRSDDDPVLEPTHYETYREGPVPDYGPRG
ncbi:hypothetical protein L6V77_27475 [Myxococcota bacterium]|jgi:hypothetical protein|nr:hypothetical protein [Myxococcota bacterium]